MTITTPLSYQHDTDNSTPAILLTDTDQKAELPLTFGLKVRATQSQAFVQGI